MWITIKGVNSTKISNTVFEHVTSVYPEERLSQRPVFEKAFLEGSIELKDLKNESDKILIPWQMFLLDKQNLEAQIKLIEKNRGHKVSSKLLDKRKGLGNTTSKRIIDRLIRQQNFLKDTGQHARNNFCGSLKGLSVVNAVSRIQSYFDIDREAYWGLPSKVKTLEYFIKKVEIKNINVSRGVLSNRILPNHQVVGNELYKGTSGFAIQDDSVPFIFLPSETNPEEAESRQIYTLVYLLVVIGLNSYKYILEKDFRAKLSKASRIERLIHGIVSELLLPDAELEKYQGTKITTSVRDNLSSRFKVSPLALLTTLKIRGIITESEFEELREEKQLIKKTQIRSPRVSTSVRKFCGTPSYDAITQAIRSGRLANTQAQYLIFGSISKRQYRQFLGEIGL